ncbi:MAG: amino acid adenylation domain-containing protein [Clostridia bacterium]|nr:amino acid adenylation domain-containing protein [Clostridia bacterium]
MEKKMYNLTYPQKNIWLMEKFHNNLPINSIVGTVEINKDFDEKKCNEAINSVIKNNDAMRLYVSKNESDVGQYLTQFNYNNYEVVDMSLFSEDEKQRNINDYVLRPLFLENSGLYDFKILNYGNNKGAILMKVHHIISDAWSCSRIGTQLIEFMESESNQENSTDELKPSYLEFIESEKEYENSEKYQKDEDFWKEYLKGIGESVAMKGSSSKTDANRYSVTLDKHLNEKINEYCKENKISPYVLFLAALSTYIYRIKDNNDIVLGTPVLNRSNFKEKNMLGMFVSTLPIRVKIEENQRFLDLAKSIGTNTLTLFRHQRYPYSKTLEYIHKETVIKDNLYNIVLSYQNARTSLIDQEKYSTTWPFVKHLNDELQIHIMDMDNTGVLNINYDYKTDLFEDVEIEYLHTRMMAIIEDAINNVEVNVEDIRIMTKEEENKILYEFNDTDADYPKDKTVIELFEEQVKKTPDNIAIIFEDCKITYRELNERANKLAHYLTEKKNVQQGDIISLLLDRTPEIIISMLAISKTGAAYLPIDVEFPIERIKYMLNDTSSRLLITNKDLDNEFNIEYIDIREKLSNYSNKNLSNKHNMSDIMYIIYTSGTTGKPKGVIVKNTNVTNLLFAAYNYEELSECKAWGAFSTYSFDISVLEIFVPLVHGKVIVLANEAEQKMPDKMGKLIQNNQIDVINMTPTRMKLLLDYDDKNNFLKSLKRIMLGGEVFPNIFFRKLKTMTKAKIYDGYGPTEITVWSSAKLINEESDINIGKALPNMKSFILDSNNELLPINVVGELCIGGKGVSTGYFNNIEATKKSFVDFDGETVYKTGDLAYYNFSGDLVYVGRKDSQIKLHGLRIEIEEIETIIRRYDGILQAAVIVNDRSQLLAYYCSSKNIVIKDLKKYLKSFLPKYMIPQFYMQVKEMSINTLGKIDKSKLPNINVLINEYIEPVNSRQKLLVDFIKKELNLVRFGITNDLFEVGGDSLFAIKLSLYINDKFNTNITPKEIFDNSTVELLEKSMDKISIKKDENIICDQQRFPLTMAQKGIFSSYSLDPDNVMYNTPFELEFPIDINLDLLMKSVEDTINSNETFFDVIEVYDGELYQSINNDNKLILNNIAISEEDYLVEKKHFVRPFDLMKGPLYRVKVYNTTKKIYVLFDFHHIIFDGYSMSNLLYNIKNNYEKLSNKIEQIYFGKIAFLEEKQRNSVEYSKAKKFFMEKFEGELPINSLPTDRPRKIRTYRGDKITVALDVDVAQKIRKFSAEHGITINNIFLAMFNFILSKYMFNEDVIIGIASLGRKTARQLSMIGMFVKTLPFRTYINYNNNILDYMKQVQDNVMTTLENDAYSYESLVKDLNIKRYASRNPLFDIMYVYQNDGIPDFQIDNKKIMIKPFNTVTSKFDLTCEVLPNNDRFDINIEYSKDLFNKSTVESFARNYENALIDILDNENIKLSDITIINKREKDSIIHNFNNTKSYYNKAQSLIEIFEKQVNKNPNNIAIVCDDKKITYKELNEKSNQLAWKLNEMGIKVGDKISLLIDKSIELMIGIIAILKNRAVYVPIEIDYPINRIKYMVEDSESKMILISSKWDMLPNIKKLDISLNNSTLYNNKMENINLKYNVNDMAYIMYTSGTTGKPKGVLVNNINIISLLCNTNYIHFKKNDRIIQTGSTAFDATTFEYWGALLNSLPLYLLKKEELLDLVNFEKYIKNNKITIMFLTTQLFNRIVEYRATVFSNLRILLTGGEALSIKHINLVREKCPLLNLNNVYGPTENTTFSTYYPITKKIKRALPIGKPISNCTCYIVDKCNNLLPKGVPGELIVGGDGVAKGYLNKEEINKEKFIDDIYSGNGKMYKTGDLCLLNKEENIEFIGRIDTQVKIRGFRIEPDEINQKLLEYKDVSESIVLVEEKDEEKILVAYYTSDVEIDRIELITYLKRSLPLYMIPNYFVRVSKIPLNSNGKTDKLKLYTEGRKIIEAETKKVKLNYTGIYLSIYELFCEVLKKTEINYDDNFFDIGGDSLLAIKLVTRAMAKNLPITYPDIFKNPTIRELGQMLDKTSCKDSISSVIQTYDYTKINELLSNNVINSYLEHENNIGNILLTGVTGFLGAHILNAYMQREKGKIYCIVRKKDGKDYITRIKEKIQFFFGNRYDDEFDKRIFVIEGDITNKKIVTNDKDYDIILNNVDTVINSAANVKHFGRMKIFQDINVLGVQNVVNFCLKNNKRLIHISTLSISGNLLEAGQIEQKNIKPNTLFDETNFYIGQNLDNVYAYTKFAAEKIVYDSIIYKGLDAKIMRMGNLTGRWNDGKFQPNVEENAFANRLKTMIELEIIPDNILSFYLEFTPIDYAAEAVLKLAKTSKQYNTFHLFNHKHAEMKFVDQVLNNMGILTKHISKNEMTKILDKLMKQKNGFKKIQGIVLDINQHKELDYESNIVVKSDFTTNVLKKLKFEWPTITDEYIIRYIQYLFDIEFLKKRGIKNDK